MEEFAQHQLRIGGERGLVERPVHQGHPAIAGALIQPIRVMPHPQARMTSRLLVPRRPAESPHEKVPQSNLGASQVILRIHRAQHVILGHLRVEGRHQSREPVFADPLVDITF